MPYFGNEPAKSAIKVGDNTVLSATIANGVIINEDIKSDAAIAMSKTALVAGTGITLATNTLNVDAAQTQITSVGTLTSLATSGVVGITVANVSGVTASTDADDLVIENTAHNGISILTNDNQTSNLYFGQASSNRTARVDYAGDTNIMHVGTTKASGQLQLQSANGTTGITLDASSNATFAGQIKASDGTAGAPSYSFSTDPDTGIYWGGTNSMGFVTGGTSRMELRSTGSLVIGAVADEGDAIITNGADGGRYDVLTVQENGNARWNLSFEGSGATNSLTLNSNSTSNVMHWDNATGNVGIGTTAPVRTLEVAHAGAHPAINISGSSNASYTNRATIGFNYGTGSSGFAMGTALSDGAEDFYLYDAYDSAIRLIVDTSGNVGIGTTSPVSPSGYSTTLALAAGGEGPAITFRDTGTSNKSSYILNQSGALKIGTMEDAGGGVTHQMMLRTGLSVFGAKVGSVDNNPDSYQISWGGDDVSNPRWGFRIDSEEDLFLDANLNVNGRYNALRIDKINGWVGIGLTTTLGHKLQVESNANTFVQKIQNTHGTSPYGIAISHDADTDNNSHKFLNCEGAGNNRCIIYTDGDVNNSDNGYGSISDVRIKQGIRDANSQWDDIKAIKVRNFKKNEDVLKYKDKAWEQIGVIAQELESSGMDKLVRDRLADEFDIANNEDINEGDKVKSVQYSIIYMKAIKALQEAMAKIETLESKVTALENA